MKRYVIKTMKLNEISSVDRPAQVGAVSVLMKRAEDPETTLIKATFQQALTGCLLADQVRDAFYNAFENMYEGKDAFRKALVDELAAGGSGDVAAADYKTWLASLVDRATVAAKAAGAANMPAELNKVFTEAADEWLANQQEHDMLIIKNRAELTAAIAKFQSDGDKATMADLSAIQKAATELKAEDALPASGPLAKVATPVDTELTKRFDRLEKASALSVDLRKHYDGLADDAARDTFLAKSAADQLAEIAKGGGDDPVVYTTLDGIPIHKSAGDTTLAMAKRLDTQSRALAKAEATTEDTVLTKRVNDELDKVGGELIGKKALLKAVDGITDEPTRAAALAVLKSANELGKGAFVRKGHGGANLTVVENSDAPNEAEAQLDELAKAEAARSNVTFEKAYTTVIQTSEGSKLYAQSLGADAA